MTSRARTPQGAIWSGAATDSRNSTLAFKTLNGGSSRPVMHCNIPRWPAISPNRFLSQVPAADYSVLFLLPRALVTFSFFYYFFSLSISSSLLDWCDVYLRLISCVPFIWDVDLLCMMLYISLCLLWIQQLNQIKVKRKSQPCWRNVLLILKLLVLKIIYYVSVNKRYL